MKSTNLLRPPISHPGALWIASVLLLSVAAWSGDRAAQLGAVASEAEARAGGLTAALAVKPAPKKSRSALEEQKRWAALRVERDFAWPVLFAAIEQAGSTDIELLGFEPDKANRRIVLSGEARNREALLKFVDNLAGQSALNKVHLSLQLRKKQERRESIVFEVRAAIAL